MTYQQANDLLVGRCKNSRCWDYCTKLVRDGDDILVKHGNTTIVRLYPDGRVSLYGGWLSSLTRINRCLPNRHSAFQYCGYWGLLHYREGGPTVYFTFADGMTVHPDGTITGYDPEPWKEKIAAHKKAIRDRNKKVSVDSARGFRPGDILRSTRKGEENWSYLVTRCYRNENTYTEWLRLRRREDGATIISRIPGWRNRWKLDPFLTAVKEANEEL